VFPKSYFLIKMYNHLLVQCHLCLIWPVHLLLFSVNLPCTDS
jgi:hypothetical protein